MKGLFGFLLGFVYPDRCVVCDHMDVVLCKSCFGKLRLSLRKDKDLDAVWEYKDKMVKKIIERIKFDFDKRLVGVLFEFLGEFGLRQKVDLVVAVPLHRYRYNWRGFNQAEEIGRCVAEKIGVGFGDALWRTRKTKQQARLNNKGERQRNVKEAFAVRNEWEGELAGKRVLLVDDVWTSGTTMRECSRMLRGSGVAKVFYFVLAR